MKIRIISTRGLVVVLALTLSLSSEEIDYKKLFQQITQSLIISEAEEEKATLIENDPELKQALESGFNSFNVISPYAHMKDDLKRIISELSNFKFTLRSASNTQIYENAVDSTVLVVAPEIGIGSGFIVDRQKGLIATNFHVTSGLKNVLVAFYDKNIQDPTKLKFHTATVYKYSAKRDVAILKLNTLPQGLQELELVPNASIKVGEEVHTIGHPMSLMWTYSHGLVTSVRNNFQFGEEEKADVIQIDANISPGNSGGPLLNSDGNVIGMVTFSASDQLVQNLNFAISAKEINSILGASKNEETTASGIVKELLGMQLLSYEDVMRRCRAYGVDEDGDGVTDYFSLKNISTNKEEYRYIKRIEIEIEPGNKQLVNILCMDVFEDGIMDTFLWDFNLDNKFDSIMIDINQDGEPDILGVDSEGKGFITEAWIL